MEDLEREIYRRISRHIMARTMLVDYIEALDWDAVDWLDWARANRN